MVKQRVYDLLDEEFAYFVHRLGDELNREGFKHNIVGGVAVQSHILDRLTRLFDTDLAGLVLMDDFEKQCKERFGESFRLQDFIRATDDIDVALESRGTGLEADSETTRRLRSVYEKISGYYFAPSGQGLFAYICLRDGMRRPTFLISPDGSGGTQISLNVSRHRKDLERLRKGYYDIFIEQGRKLVLPYEDDFKLTLRVPKLEHVIAPKMAVRRGKDYMDVHNLVTAAMLCREKINLTELRQILGPRYLAGYEHLKSFIRSERRK